MRVIAYTRVSTDEQAKGGHSLDQQASAARAYCELHGHELVDVITDPGVSASRKLELRPGGAELTRRIVSAACEGVVILRWDRAFRDTLDGLLFVEFLRKHDCAIHSIHDHVDTSTPEGKLHLTILLGTAQYERDKIAQRATHTCEALRRDAKAWGAVPFGCTRVGNRIYRDPETWPLRERVVDLREQGLTLREMAKALDADKTMPPPGVRWVKRKSAKKARPVPAKHWSLSTIKRVLDTHDYLEAIPYLPASLEAAASTEARA